MKAKYTTRIDRNILIPVRDGTMLAADIVRPDLPGKFPVIVEYTPYRKDDASRSLLDALCYFAESGFIAVRLDVRGTGSSGGITTDEYAPEEQQDGCDAIEWLATQPWSNGNIGMWGTSYGGFTAIQVAMHQPPHLKAIAPMYATDDRYTDDCHYTSGGNMRMYYDVGHYGGMMVVLNALPPLPEAVGARWAEAWQERLERNQPYLLSWMKHQVDGLYWRHASLRPNYHRIKCPVFLIGGWRDGYANAMLRMYVNLKCPKRLLMGPWVHTRPDQSAPGPRIHYLHELVMFFEQYLRDGNTGNSHEANLTFYMQEATIPDRRLQDTPGYWRHENSNELPAATDLTWYLHDGGVLSDRSCDVSPPHEAQIEYLPASGIANGFWSAGGMPFYLADDQRTDEAYSLTFTSSPFEQDLHLLGWPKIVLYASSTAKVATFVAKLSDVSPDGRSVLIVDGSLNGTRRSSLTNPQPMTPGEVYELHIPMNPTGWVIKAGHKLRLAISGGDFPNLWPTPEHTEHCIRWGKDCPSHITIPSIPVSQLDPPRFLPPPTLPEVVKHCSPISTQTMTQDHINGTITLTCQRSSKTTFNDVSGILESDRIFHCTTSIREPAQASIVGTHKNVLTRNNDRIEICAESSIRATSDCFHILINLNVKKNGEPLFHKKWVASEPRQLL